MRAARRSAAQKATIVRRVVMGVREARSWRSGSSLLVGVKESGSRVLDRCATEREWALRRMARLCLVGRAGTACRAPAGENGVRNDVVVRAEDSRSSRVAVGAQALRFSG